MAPDHVRAAWWVELGRVLGSAQRAHKITWVVLIDANARVGSIASSAVGTAHVEVENSNGAYLRKFAEGFHMRIANTWPPSGHTWTSSHGTRSRLDYIL
eukprot:3975908-Karenia_brevis.AAC.1